MPVELYARQSDGSIVTARPCIDTDRTPPINRRRTRVQGGAIFSPPSQGKHTDSVTTHNARLMRSRRHDAAGGGGHGALQTRCTFACEPDDEMNRTLRDWDDGAKIKAKQRTERSFEAFPSEAYSPHPRKPRTWMTRTATGSTRSLQRLRFLPSTFTIRTKKIYIPGPFPGGNQSYCRMAEK